MPRVKLESGGEGRALVLRRGSVSTRGRRMETVFIRCFLNSRDKHRKGGVCLCGVLFSLIEMPSDSLLGKVMETPTTHDLSGAMP